MTLTATPTTPTTPTTPRPLSPELHALVTAALPTFTPRGEREGWTSYGRRAMLHALRLNQPMFGALDDAALEAAAEACSQASTARDISAVTLECLKRLQAELRARLASRQADAATRADRLAAWLEASGARQGDEPAAGKAEGAPTQADAPEGSGDGGGGGSKVRRQPKAPKPSPAPAFALPAMDLSDAF